MIVGGQLPGSAVMVAAEPIWLPNAVPQLALQAFFTTGKPLSLRQENKALNWFLEGFC
jgi:hypothetical protein